MSDHQDIPQDEALAAEYVLRLLDAEATKAFEARLQSEPELLTRVRDWEAEFAQLGADLPEETPSPKVRRALMAQLNGAASGPQRRWIPQWLAWPSFAAIAVAGFLVFSSLLRGPDFDPTLHATLISADGRLHIEAGYAQDGNLFKVIPQSGEPATGRDFELWVVNDRAAAPVSLGVISATQESLFEITPEVAALIDGGILAVSDEPKGGSPTGAPTGAVLATDAFFDANLFEAG